MVVKSVKYLSAISLNERIQYLKLLFRWQGSLWKELWADFLCFIAVYTGVALLYRLYLINDPVLKIRFEAVVQYMKKAGNLVPLTFLLGFFVSTVLGRWWGIIGSIPWMTKSSFCCQALITGGDHLRRRHIQLTVVRYMNLAWILSVMKLSEKVKNRFVIKKEEPIVKTPYLNRKAPKIQTYRETFDKINADEVVKKHFGKLILEEEIIVFDQFQKTSKNPPHIIPLMWTTKLLEKSFNSGYIKYDKLYLQLYNLVLDFRGSLGSLSVFNEFNVPLVYTQVIIIVVYTFLISEIFTEQLLDNVTTLKYNNSTGMVNINSVLENYFPVFGIFKFLIYMGWFKVGLSFINPFGNESSDLPLDKILDYNLEISSSIAPCGKEYFPEYLTSQSKDETKEKWELFDLATTKKQEMVLMENMEEITNNKYENNVECESKLL